MNDNKESYRVLSIDGGGMRGYYSALYLDGLIKLAKGRRFQNSEFNLTNQFDMLVGTSTGAIIACGLLNGISPEEIATFYKEYGARIFPKKMPTKWCHFPLAYLCRESINKKGNNALKEALKEIFNEKTLQQIYDETKKALVIPSVNATTHKAYIFKTPHNTDTNERDNDITLVDACLASSAAPIYRSLASIDDNLYVDGGLYANNPVLVALSEALRLTSEGKDKDKDIEIYCLGMSLIKSSEIDANKPDWGFREWKFGANITDLSIDAQEGAFDYLSKEFAKHISRNISIVRFPTINHTIQPSIDDASIKTLNSMKTIAQGAIDETNKLIDEQCQNMQLIKSLLQKIETKKVS